MASPFPGMDPFLEGQKWKGFHHSLISVIRDALMPLVRPRYVVDVEEKVFLATNRGEPLRFVTPDVAVIQSHGWMEHADGKLAVDVEPCVLTLPVTDLIEQPYLVIRSRNNEDTVTVIEVLSPTNKGPGPGSGHGEYLAKRNEYLRSSAHLIELDLLRGGVRLPAIELLPDGDFFAFVSRAERRPKVEVYAWTLERRLPSIPVPLASGDPEVVLDLQSVFDLTYDRAGYDYALNYSRPTEPALSDRQQNWVSERLADRKS